MKTRYGIVSTAIFVGSMVHGSGTSASDPAIPHGVSCPDGGDVNGVNDDFPNRMSTLVGRDIRTGGHDCFERVVLELQGTGELPGYFVRYESDPILEDPSGLPVDIAGDATLVVSFGSWFIDPDGNGYTGPREIIPANVVNILELELIENNEGQSSWGIGLDRQRDFVVTTLTEPVRIVIDVARDPTGAPPTTPGPATPPSLPPTL